MRVPHRHARWVLALPLVVGMSELALATPAAAIATADRYSDLREILRHRGVTEDRSAEDLLFQLVALGPDAIPSYFDLVTGRGIDDFLGDDPFVKSDWVLAPDELSLFARQALERMPAQAVLDHLLRAVRGDSELGIRLAAVRIVGELGQVEGLDLVWRTVEGLDELTLASVSIRAELSDALARILRQDNDAWRAIRDFFTTAEPDVRPILLSGLRSAGGPRAFEVIEDVLREESGTERAMVETLVALEVRYPWALSGRSAPFIEALADSSDKDERELAVHLSLEIADPAAVERVIEQLEDRELLVRLAAHRTLESIASMRLESDIDLWLDWFEEQSSSWDATSREFETALDASQAGASQAGTLARAARRFGRFAVHRHDAARLLAETLLEQPTTCWPASCRVLGRLGSNAALPGLLDAMEFGEEELQECAWEALQVISRTEKPQDIDLWRSFVEGS